MNSGSALRPGSELFTHKKSSLPISYISKCSVHLLLLGLLTNTDCRKGLVALSNIPIYARSAVLTIASHNSPLVAAWWVQLHATHLVMNVIFFTNMLTQHIWENLLRVTFDDSTCGHGGGGGGGERGGGGEKRGGPCFRVSAENIKKKHNVHYAPLTRPHSPKNHLCF